MTETEKQAIGHQLAKVCKRLDKIGIVCIMFGEDMLPVAAGGSFIPGFRELLTDYAAGMLSHFETFLDGVIEEGKDNG